MIRFHDLQKMKASELIKLTSQTDVIVTVDGVPSLRLIPYKKQLDVKLYKSGMVVKPGEKLIVRVGNKTIEMIAPEIDADGHPMPDYG